MVLERVNRKVENRAGSGKLGDRECVLGDTKRFAVVVDDVALNCGVVPFHRMLVTQTPGVEYDLLLRALVVTAHVGVWWNKGPEEVIGNFALFSQKSEINNGAAKVLVDKLKCCLDSLEPILVWFLLSLLFSKLRLETSARMEE